MHDDNVDIKVIGTDNGTMDCFLYKFNTLENTYEVTEYSDVPITPEVIIQTKPDFNGTPELYIDNNRDGFIDEIFSPTSIDLVVIPTVQIPDEEIAEADKESLIIAYSIGDLPNSVINSLDLITKGINGSLISWASSNPEIVSEDGTVNRPLNGMDDQEVTLTATIIKGNNTEQKKFNVIVKQHTTIIIGKPTTLPNINGWYKNDVIVHFEASDSEYGIKFVSEDIVIYEEGSNISITGMAENNNGESVIYKVEGINIDKTSPTITTNLQNKEMLDRIGAFELISKATDDLSGINKFEVYLDDYLIEPTSTIDLESLDFGEHQLKLIAEDNAGNITEKLLTINITATKATLDKLLGRYLDSQFIYNDGIYNSLDKKLLQEKLTSFINEIEAQQGKHISYDAATTLIEYAEWIIFIVNENPNLIYVQ